MCTLGDFFIAVYLLLLGTPQAFSMIFDDKMGKAYVGTIILVVIFTVLAFLIFLAVILLIVIDSKSLETDELMLDSYWVRILTSYHMTHDALHCFCTCDSVGRESKMLDSPNVSKGDKTQYCPVYQQFGWNHLYKKVENCWGFLTSAFTHGHPKSANFWYIQGSNCALISQLISNLFFVWLIGFIVIPI